MSSRDRSLTGERSGGKGALYRKFMRSSLLRPQSEAIYKLIGYPIRSMPSHFASAGFISAARTPI